MSDLIERLEIIERYLLDVSNGKDAEYEYAECIRYTIATLREQEKRGRVMNNDLIERNKTITDALTYGTGFIENGKHIPIGDAMKNDLIERMEKYLNTIPDDMRYTSPNDFVRMLDESLTTLREQEIINKLHPTKTKLRARIEELEAAEERSAEYLAESVENEVEALEKIKRLDAALAELRKSTSSKLWKDFIDKTRAGE
jgi:hypothetical protein